MTQSNNQDQDQPQDADLIKRAGPYSVHSKPDGSLAVYPQWSGLDGKPGWRRTNPQDEEKAGGPGIFSRMVLAHDVEDQLNGQKTTPEQHRQSMQDTAAQRRPDPDPGQPEPTRDTFWTTVVPPIRHRLEQQNSQDLHRLRQLATLLSNLEIYQESIQATIEGLDPDDPSPEAVYGDEIMEETINMLRTLLTIPARLPDNIGQRPTEQYPPTSGEDSQPIQFDELLEQIQQSQSQDETDTGGEPPEAGQ